MNKKSLGLLGVLILLGACGSKTPETAANGNASLNAGNTPPNYTARIGIAVRTDSRTCVAIQNSTVTAGTQLTVISPVGQASVMPATISGPSETPCPITKEVQPGMSSYNLDLGQNEPPKLTPLIAVLADPSNFKIVNNVVQGDLEQNGKTESFRACDSADGVHLSAWNGNPLSGTPLWQGYYYESGNPGTAPACTNQEVTAQH